MQIGSKHFSHLSRDVKGTYSDPHAKPLSHRLTDASYTGQTLSGFELFRGRAQVPADARFGVTLTIQSWSEMVYGLPCQTPSP